MPKVSAKFGFWPKKESISMDAVQIETLDDASNNVESVLCSEWMHKDWFYAPTAASYNIVSGVTTQLPYSSRVFQLPFTHRITHTTDDNKQHLDFLVWCLGFFEGIRLTTSEAGYLDATPVKTGKLTDFILTNGTQLSDAVELAERYWMDNMVDMRQGKRMIGVIHCLFLAQNPKHLSFERFTYLYMALDACFKLASKRFEPTKRLSHASRIEWTCQQFDIPVPAWAIPFDKGSEVSVARNDTIHEALFFEEPLGFATYGGNNDTGYSSSVLLQMEALICRLVVALLGRPDAAYVRSAVTTRQIHGLSLK